MIHPANPHTLPPPVDTFHEPFHPEWLYPHIFATYIELRFVYTEQSLNSMPAMNNQDSTLTRSQSFGNKTLPDSLTVWFQKSEALRSGCLCLHPDHVPSHYSKASLLVSSALSSPTLYHIRFKNHQVNYTQASPKANLTDPVSSVSHKGGIIYLMMAPFSNIRMLNSMTSPTASSSNGCQQVARNWLQQWIKSLGLSSIWDWSLPLLISWLYNSGIHQGLFDLLP